jgi:hypothetical protein
VASARSVLDHTDKLRDREYDHKKLCAELGPRVNASRRVPNFYVNSDV